MEHRVIKDSRGKVPNYVIEEDKMRHQPTGKEVELKGHSGADLREAHAKLKALVS